jgi:hypothetical protein
MGYHHGVAFRWVEKTVQSLVSRTRLKAWSREVLILSLVAGWLGPARPRLIE